MFRFIIERPTKEQIDFGGVTMTQGHYNQLKDMNGFVKIECNQTSLEHVMHTLHNHCKANNIKMRLFGLQIPFADSWEKLAPELEGCKACSINSVCEAFFHGVSIKLYDRESAPPIPKEDMRLYDDKHKIAAQEGYQPLASSNFVERWDRGAPFFDKTWKEVGVTTSMVYHIADEIRVGVMVMQDDILVGKHWPKNIEELSLIHI